MTVVIVVAWKVAYRHRRGILQAVRTQHRVLVSYPSFYVPHQRILRPWQYTESRVSEIHRRCGPFYIANKRALLSISFELHLRHRLFRAAALVSLVAAVVVAVVAVVSAPSTPIFVDVKRFCILIIGVNEFKP